VETRMRDENGATLKAFCWMDFVHFDLRTNKVAAHSAAYMEIFARVHQPLTEGNFDERRRSFTERAAVR